MKKKKKNLMKRKSSVFKKRRKKRSVKRKKKLHRPPLRLQRKVELRKHLQQRVRQRLKKPTQISQTVTIQMLKSSYQM